MITPEGLVELQMHVGHLHSLLRRSEPGSFGWRQDVSITILQIAMFSGTEETIEAARKELQTVHGVNP